MVTPLNKAEVQHSAQVLGINLNYYEAGAGAPLVMLHGGGRGWIA